MDPMNQHYGTTVYKGRERSGENGDLLVEKLEVFLGGESRALAQIQALSHYRGGFYTNPHIEIA